MKRFVRQYGQFTLALATSAYIFIVTREAKS